MKTKNTEGITQILILGIAAVIGIIIIASAGAYYFLKSQDTKSFGEPLQEDTETQTPFTSPSSSPSASPTNSASANSDTDDIQSELNTTTINSVDADFKSLDASSKSL